MMSEVNKEVVDYKQVAESIDKIARVSHGAYTSWIVDSYSLDNSVVASWEEKDAQLKVLDYSVVIAATKNPDATERDLHNAFLQEANRLGWIYGETLNTVSRVNPELVSFEKLNPDTIVFYTIVLDVVKVFEENV